MQVKLIAAGPIRLEGIPFPARDIDRFGVGRQCEVALTQNRLQRRHQITGNPIPWASFDLRVCETEPGASALERACRIPRCAMCISATAAIEQLDL